MYRSLSALTPAVVDDLYNISRATPVATPTFVFLIGSPGVGKSSGHALAIESGLVPAGNYATINLDSLLESLTPFRAGSAIAHYFKQKPDTRDLVRFTALPAYGSRRENVGAFTWYDAPETHEALRAAAPRNTRRMNRLRRRFSTEDSITENLIERNTAAIERAIRASVPIIYETTFALGKTGRVTKFDDIVRFIHKHAPQYHVAVLHIRGDPTDIAARIHARQEYGMPYEAAPFYRHVQDSIAAVTSYVTKNEEAFATLKKQYSKDPTITFDEVTTHMNASRLARPVAFDAPRQRRRILDAYGELTRSSDSLPSSWRVSSTESPRLQPLPASSSPTLSLSTSPRTSSGTRRTRRNRHSRTHSSRS